MKKERQYPAVLITKKGEISLRGGHPWVYEAEITEALSTLTGNADAATLDKIAKLITRRDLLLRQMLNKKRD